MNRKSKAWMMMCIGCCIIISTSCAKTDTAEQLLTNTVSHLNQVGNLSFQGKSTIIQSGTILQKNNSFEGRISNLDQCYIKWKQPASSDTQQHANQLQGYSLFVRQAKGWAKANNQALQKQTTSAQGLDILNPLFLLEALKQHGNMVKKEGQNGDNFILAVDIAPDTMKQMIENQVKQQQKQLSNQIQKMRNDATLHHPIQKNQAIANTWTQANKQLEEMLTTLSVKSHYTLWVDRNSYLLQKMSVQSTLLYSNEGKSQQETRKVVYLFKK